MNKARIKSFKGFLTSKGLFLFLKEQSLEQLKLRKTIWQLSRQNKVQRKCCWQKFISISQLRLTL